MAVITPVSTVTITPRRPTEDADGNKVFTGDPGGPAALASVQAVFSLSAPAKAAWRAHGERFIQDGVVFVPRGSDLIAGDEVTYRGATFTVVGNARGDQDHPFTGDDFGWVVYTLAGGG